MGCCSVILKKIVIVTYDDSYLAYIGKVISKTDLKINKNSNFTNYTNKYKNILYTFLSNKDKWTWIHHYSGSCGTIIIYEGEGLENNITDLENIMKSKILQKKPLLLIFDKKKISKKKIEYFEKLRYYLASENIRFLIQFIDFNSNYSHSEILYGLEWLYDEINYIK